MRFDVVVNTLNEVGDLRFERMVGDVAADGGESPVGLAVDEFAQHTVVDELADRDELRIPAQDELPDPYRH